MSDLTPYKFSLPIAETKGERICSENEFFRLLSSVMENHDFQTLHDKYVNDSYDVQTIAIFMKMYKLAGDHELNLSPNQKIAIIKDAMCNKEIRGKIMHNCE
jgi:hypothetical protein